MKSIVKYGVFGLFLACFGVITPYTYADSGDNSGVDTGSISGGTTGETGGATGETGGTVTTYATYTVNYYKHNIGNTSYSLESTATFTGEVNGEMAVSDLVKFITGYTFELGYANTGTTVKPSTGAVTAVTGSSVINMYYRPNRLYVQYDVNGGKVRNGGDYATSGSLLTYKGNTKMLRGIYGSTMGAVDTSNYTVNGDGLHNLSTLKINTNRSGYKIESKKEWNSKPNGDGVSYNEGYGLYRANGFAGADLTKGDAVVTVYVNWIPIQYDIIYILNEGEEILSNPTKYTIRSGDITLNDPSKTGYTFLGRSGTDIEGLSTGVVITGDSIGNRVFEAVWQINSYSITYDIDGSNKIIVTGDYNTGVSQPQDPVRNGYRFLGWDTETPANMPADNIVITAKWEKLGYSGAGRRSSSTKDDSADGSDKIDDNKKSEDDSKSDDTGNQDKNSGSGTGEILEGSDGKIDMDDLMNVYLWARDNGITTGETLEAALPDGYIERGEMAKLVVDFVQDVLKREIPANIPSQCNRGDNETEWKSDEVKKYAEQSCALGLMGIYMQNFKPNKLLDRAEFGTIVSRLLWGDKFNKPNATRFNKFYTNHLEEVKKQNLITKIDNPEAMKELRKWIWTVLKKIDK